MDFKKELCEKELQKDVLIRKLFWSFSLFLQLFLIIALAVSLVENISKANSIAIAIMNIIPMALMLICFLTKKHQECYLAIVLCTNCIMMPIIYCFSGGTVSGMPAIFTVGLALCATCSTKRHRFIALAPTLIAFIAAFVIEIVKPEIIAVVDAKTSMIDISLSVIICGTIFFAYLGIVMESRDDERNSRIAELTKRNASVQDLLSSQIKNVENIKHIYHNTGKHWQILSDMLANGETKEAIAYLNTLQGRKENFEDYTYCENSMMNRCFNFLKKQCEKNNITLTINANVPDELDIDNVDLVSIVTSLSDNAFEACSDNLRTEKRIVITSRVEDDVLIFECSNTFERHLTIRDGMLVNQGIGIMCVQKSLVRYNGTINYSQDGSMLKCVVRIPSGRERRK